MVVLNPRRMAPTRFGLHVVADTLAAAAEDTFVHVADDGRSHLRLRGDSFAAVEGHGADVEAQCQRL